MIDEAIKGGAARRGDGEREEGREGDYREMKLHIISVSFDKEISII